MMNLKVTTIHQGDLVVEGNLKCTILAVNGNLSVSGHVNARRSLHVSGSVTVGKSLTVGIDLKSGGNVTVGRSIRGGRVHTGGSVKALEIRLEGSLVAVGSITAHGSIEAGQRIHAGQRIRSHAFVYTPTFEIFCQELKTNHLPLGRAFWASLPVFAPWKAHILDPSLCWDEWRALGKATDLNWLSGANLGHWSLEAQLRMFLGLESVTTAPAEAQIALEPVTVRIMPASERASSVELLADPVNPLLQIVNDPTVTPFPDYANNPSYQAILTALKTANVLNMDLRAAYPDLNIDLDSLYVVVSGISVADPSVKTQVLAELAGANNVRRLKTNLDNFLANSVLLHDLQVQYVGKMVEMDDADVVGMDLISIFNDIFAALNLIDGAGAIVVALEVAVTIAEQSANGTFGQVHAIYDQLVGGLMTEFQKVLAQNANMAETILTDWGKLERTNALIIDGTLSWPADTNAALTAASNSYEINLFKAMLPIHFYPNFSIWSWTKDTRNNCGNTVWMQYGGWGNIGWPPHDPSQQFIPYWLNNGGIGFEDHCVDAENELARLGVTIENLTMGTGLWGPDIWADVRSGQYNGQEYRPGCVAKS